MATSPIYSWPEPDNTDLVKNGALAIRTLGDAIDTTMATMVAKTIVDAKGDIIAATAADTVSKLTVGANNTVLTADSSTATGLKWATPSSGTPAFVGVGLYNQAVSFAYTAGVNKQITFTTENFDTNTFHDNSTNTSRITIPTGYAGKYNIQATWASDSAGSYGNIYLYKNGSAITNIGTDGGKIVGIGGMSNNYFAINGGVTISLAEADYVEMYIQFSNTVTINTYAKFSATFLGA
jgi:hypothetical protein